jgi:uncharacterized protein (TIGR02996 family)
MTHQDFVDAILAEPSADVPRLIYADWLEERGEPRAEFIRVQVEMATLALPLNRNSMYGNPMPWPRNRRDTPRFRELWQRQLDLLRAHCAEWAEPLIGEATGVIFERGCVEGISTEPQTFVKHAALWYRSMPIRQLRVAVPTSMKDEDWASLLGSPHLLNIRTLELGWGVKPRQVAALADCPHVANVEEFFPGHLDQKILQKLRQSPNLKNARFFLTWPPDSTNNHETT